MNDRKITLHYNIFDTLEEQLISQNYKCSKIKEYDETKDNILKLWFGNYLTDTEKDKCLNRLHKKIVTDIRKENM